MTTITPSGYFHKRIHILPRHNRIWAYRPSSIYFSTNRNTPVSATVGLITHKISPTIQKYNLICKLYYLIHKFYIKELIIYCYCLLATPSSDLSYMICFQIITANWLILVFPYLTPMSYQVIGIRVQHRSATLYCVNDKWIAFDYVYSQHIYLFLGIFPLS